MKVTLVEESGSHLLLARGDRFVIVERRNNRIYNCYDGKRDGIAADDLSAIHQIIDETDWVDEPTGRAAFNVANKDAVLDPEPGLSGHPGDRHVIVAPRHLVNLDPILA